MSACVIRFTLIYLLSVLWIDLLPATEPLSIGTRRELFVDDALVDHLSGEAEIR